MGFSVGVELGRDRSSLTHPPMNRTCDFHRIRLKHNKGFGSWRRSLPLCYPTQAR
jgi:hypothetical protein